MYNSTKTEQGKERVYLFVIGLLLVLATYKYVCRGEAYIFETGRSTETVTITAERVLSQNIIIDKKAIWRNDAYSISFAPVSNNINGVIQFELWQYGVQLQSYKIKPSEICNQQKNGFYALTQFDYSKLDRGVATVIIKGVDLDKGIDLYIVDNTYNIPDCSYDEIDAGKTLVQKYSYYFSNVEFNGRLILYAVFVMGIFVSFYIIFTKDENRKVCNLIQIILLISYVAVSYIYSSIFFFEPVWAEAVTNFMHNALNKSVLENLVISDAGYLPLFQRLISIIIIKVFHIKAYYALYIMQILSYVISGYVLSFLVKIQFKSYMPLRYRYIMYLIFIMQMTTNYTGAFINFINYGIIVILMYFLVDSDAWSKWEFICICGFSCLSCMSKGQYVIIFPFMMLCFIAFHGSFNKRDKIFTGICFTGAMVQFIYYFFSPYGGDWISNSGQDDYIIKIIFECIRDVPMSFFSILGQNVIAINGASLLIVIVFWGITIWFFSRKILLKWIKRESVDIDTRNICMMFVFLGAQCLFFKLTRAGVISGYDIATDEFWDFYAREVSWRYELFGYVPVLLIGLITVRMSRQYSGKNMEKLALIIFWGSIVIANPRLQIKGIGTDYYSQNRDYVSSMNTEYCLLKDIEKVDCRVVPIQPNKWTYRKNAEIYLIGDNVLGLDNVIYLPNEEDVTRGKACLSDLKLLNREAGIWQIFIEKNNLVNCSKYKLLLKDQNENIINQIEQDNTEYQKLVSFTFQDAMYDVDEIEILDSQNNSVYIENVVYVVTGIGDGLNREFFGIDEFNNIADIQNFTLEQDFVALTDKLSMVSIYFGTYNRVNNGIIHVALCDKKGTVMAQKPIDAATIRDNSWKSIIFDNVKLELLEQYTIKIYSYDFSGDNNVAVYANNTDFSNLPAAKVNGISQDFVLAVRLYGEEAHVERLLNFSKIDGYVDIQDSIMQQSFVATKDEIDAVRLCFGTYNRRNEGMIHVEICDEYGNIVQKTNIDASELKDNVWETVRFDKCKVTTGKKYSIRIYSNDFSDDNNVAICTETLNGINGGVIEQNGDNEIFGAEIDGVSQDYALGVEIYGIR